jgi:hypothetical protein
MVCECLFELEPDLLDYRISTLLGRQGACETRDDTKCI